MHHKKRRDLFLRTVTYIIMTVSVTVLVSICIFFILGYSVDKKTGKPEQGGLVQFRTFPTGADVIFDGSKQSFKTPGKANGSAGYHSVSMSKEKYRDWNKNFTLKAGELLWLNALFVPESLTTDEVQTFPDLTSLVASPDKKWLAATEAANQPVVHIIDIRDEKKPKPSALELPESIVGPTKPEDTFSIAEWDFGSRFILIKHISGDKIQWLSVDRTKPENTVNISALLGVNISDIHYSGTSGNVFYALADQSIRKLNISQNTISSPIANNVKEFKLYKEDLIAYVADDESTQRVGVYKEGDKKPTTVKIINDMQPVHVSLSSYFDENFMAISHQKSVEIIKNPTIKQTRKSVANLSLSEDIGWVFFSNNGQFVVAQSGTTLASYNIERNQSFSFTIPGHPNYTRTTHLKWLDDFHLWSDNDGTLSIFEFDGSNIETIGTVEKGYDVTLSDNSKRLFSVGVNETSRQKVLQSSVMVIE